MGKMKEIYMEIQEKFDGEIPANFDYDAFLDKKIKEMKAKKEPVSNCCAANMSRLVSEDGPSFEDLGICPDCHDHCSTEVNPK